MTKTAAIVVLVISTAFGAGVSVVRGELKPSSPADPQKQEADRLQKVEGDLQRLQEEYNGRLQRSSEDITRLRNELKTEQSEFQQTHGLAEVPVGTILPYFGDPAALPSNWRLCDNSMVGNEQNSPFANKRLPDLRKKFLRGAKADEAESVIGGSGGTDWIPDHVHFFSATDNNVWFPLNSLSGWAGGAHHPMTNVTWFLDSPEHVDPEYDNAHYSLIMPADASGDSVESHGHAHGHSSVSGTTGAAAAHDNRPSFVSVYFIIRIR